MGRRKGKGKSRVQEEALPPPWLAPIISLLLLTGLGASLYLGHLHLLVQNGSGAVDSFCNINQAFNCVTVATSNYSSFLGLPIALYGIEFFAGALLLLLLGAWRVIPIKRWDSLIFILTGMGLPICAALAWISAYRIHSFCIMCLLVYGMVATIFLLLLFAGRGRVAALIGAGPREVLAWAGTGAGLVTLTVVAALAFSQFSWVPGLLNAAPVGTGARGQDVNVKGLVTSGTSIGAANAPIRIEEFTDYQCPYCSKAHQVMMQLLLQFPDKIRLTHRDYPLDNACNPQIKRVFHPQACNAAIYARCASRQGKFWPYDKLLFKNGKMLSELVLEQLAAEVGLDMKALRACVKNPIVRQVIVDDLLEGNRRGVQGTPAFFVNGEKIVGARPLEFWVEKVNTLLQEK